MRNGVKEMALLDATAVEPAKPNEALEVQPPVEMFERLARDPGVDVDKLERLMQMHERMSARLAEERFNAAMSTAQARMRPVSADANNPQTRSKYASYGALDKALRPIYTDSGFGLSFDTGESPLSEHVRVLCYVTHASGHARTYHVDMPADGKGAKGGDVMTKTHAVGAAMSYGMRYLLKMIFNVAVGEDDRDGNVVDERPKPPKGFNEYWKQLTDAAEKGKAALEAVWACSEDEPYKTYRKYIANYGKSEYEALKVRAKQVGA